jgi:hypothetical protein
LDEIVTAWIAHINADAGSPEYLWAYERVMDWALQHDLEQLWEFILAAFQRDMPLETAAALAAGPIEDLLSNDGLKFIDRIEELARKDPKFNWILGGVWRNDMMEEIWQRVQSIRNHVW